MGHSIAYTIVYCHMCSHYHHILSAHFMACALVETIVEVAGDEDVGTMITFSHELQLRLLSSSAQLSSCGGCEGCSDALPLTQKAFTPLRGARSKVKGTTLARHRNAMILLARPFLHTNTRATVKL